MQKHDDKYHGGHYEEGERCEKRETMKKENEGEELSAESKAEKNDGLTEYQILIQTKEGKKEYKTVMAKNDDDAWDKAKNLPDCSYVYGGKQVNKKPIDKDKLTRRLHGDFS